MRFPLPEDTFPPLRLSEDDVDGLKRLGAVFVQDALDQFAEFRTAQHAVVDDARWKLIRRRAGLASYSDRSIKDAVSRSRGAEAAAAAASNGKISYTSARLHAVLTIGTVEGDLKDMMYGLHHSTAEVQRVKSAYMEDQLVDSRNLATIDWPTDEDPVRALRIRWAVSEFAPLLLRRVVHPRDFVFLEATGVHTTPEGERIGYNILHSLQIPEVRELRDKQIVRGHFSISGAFRQRAPGVIELYMKGFVDSKGDVHSSVTIPGTAEALMSYRKATFCGQMKKLHWFLNTKRRRRKRHGADAAGTNESYLVTAEEHAEEQRRRQICVSCGKAVKSSATSTCQVCDHGVCPSCGITRRMSFLQQPSKRIVQRSIRFCSPCVAAAAGTDAFEVAAEEHRLISSQLAAYEFSSTSDSSLRNDEAVLPSPSSSAALEDVHREFFG
jgi:hypothetical protein